MIANIEWRCAAAKECEICGGEILKGDDGELENEFFCSPPCANAYIASWE